MSHRPAILYLHGFNSSPASEKARELGVLLPRRVPGLELLVPDLGFDPARAMARAGALLAEHGSRVQGIIGSSLGGFYAAALSRRTGLPAVLINPAVYPYRLLADYLGPQTNPYTGEQYVLGADHMAVLTALDPGEPEYPERLLLLLQGGDETLDYREALQRFPRSPAWIQPAGDHRFQNLDRVVPAILGFFHLQG